MELKVSERKIKVSNLFNYGNTIKVVLDVDKIFWINIGIKK